MSREQELGFMGSFLKLASSSTTTTTTTTTSLVGPPPTPMKFKGVVLQHNGHWGAQIYANHSRIWLGTFKSEHAAAMAYDSAAMKLHQSNSHADPGALHRNLPPTREAALYEPSFQAGFTNEKLLEMIKDGSYVPRFQHFVKIAMEGPVAAAAASAMALTDNARRTQERKLFEKEMTPSDVGKLNRLVVPKKYATMYFPKVETDEGQVVRLRDRDGRRWAFRYCYWKSSQSFVFTKGWNKFVKEKGVRAKDVVGFYWSDEEGEGGYVIDVEMRENDGGGGGSGGGESGVEVDEMVERPAEVVVEEDKEKKEEEEVVSRDKRLKLFGAWVG